MCLPQHGGSRTACQAQKPGTQPSSRESQRACLAEHRSMGQGRGSAVKRGMLEKPRPRVGGERGRVWSRRSRAQGMGGLMSQKHKRQL